MDKIGKGGFGVVLRGENKYNKVYAIKIIKLKDINDKNNFINEARTMGILTDTHIVKYLGCWIDDNLGTASKFFDDEEKKKKMMIMTKRKKKKKKKKKKK